MIETIALWTGYAVLGSVALLGTGFLLGALWWWSLDRFVKGWGLTQMVYEALLRIRKEKREGV